MTSMSVRLCAEFLTCLVLLGCGSKPAPPTSAAVPDSVIPATGQEMPAQVAQTEVETASSVAPAVASPAVPAGESVPTAISRAFPSARTVRSVSEPFPHRVIQDSAGKVLGYEAFSDSAGVTARGFGGLVPVQVLFNSQGRPVRIYILDNCETPAYMDLVLRTGLLDTLLSWDPAAPERVDAVTLATSSSHAIAAGVTGLATRVAAEIAAKPGARSR